MTTIPIDGNLFWEPLGDWLVENIGPSYNSETHELLWQFGEHYECVYFIYEKDALLFTLRWL